MGFDVCDNGQYMTFYENIFTAPQTVGYHFMYYLSGLVGGTLLTMYPAMGLLGMRIVGLLSITVSMLLVYKITKGTLTATAAIVGNMLSMIAFIAVPVTFCHDLLSILLYIMAILLLWKASESHKRLLALLGGMVLGVNIFARTPNILGLVFILTPIAMALASKENLRPNIHLSLISLVGAIVGIGLTIGLMAKLGHLNIYLINLTELHSIAVDTTGETSHSLGALIMVPLNFYATEVYVWLKLTTVIYIYTIIYNKIPSSTIKLIAIAIAAAAAWYMMWRMPALQPLWALCAAGCLTMVITGKDKVRALALIALLLMIIFPLGSDNAYNNGSIIAMLASPVAAAACLEHTRHLRVAPFMIVFMLCCIGHMVVNGAYFDHGPLWHKVSTVGNERTAGIHTTPERATIVNTVLDGIKPHIKKGDTLMVYGSMPMINYLTGTYPAMGCCWPELLGATMLENRLKELDATRPPVLRQLFSSIGEDFSKPSRDFLHTYGEDTNEFMYDRKIDLLNNYLERNNYNEVYSNSHFILYISER